MRTLTVMSSMTQKNDVSFFSFKQKGFSLLEILIAVALMVVILVSIPMMFSSNQNDQLIDAIRAIKGGMRYAENEAILRNNIVRLTLDLETRPHKLSVDFATENKILLRKDLDTNQMSLDEIEQENAQRKKQDERFAPIEDFVEGSKPMGEDVFIAMAGSSLNQLMVSEGKMSFYFYPTGDHDTGIIILNTEEQVMTLTLNSPGEDMEEEFITIPSEKQGIQKNAEFVANYGEKKWEEWLKK